MNSPIVLTNAQLYFAVGLPAVVALIGVLVNVGYFVTINARLGRIDDRLDMVVSKMGDLTERVTRVETRMGIH